MAGVAEAPLKHPKADTTTNYTATKADTTTNSPTPLCLAVVI